MKDTLEEIHFDQRKISQENWEWVIGTFKRLIKVAIVLGWPRDTSRARFLARLDTESSYRFRICR